jgi:hypothetical protein
VLLRSKSVTTKSLPNPICLKIGVGEVEKNQNAVVVIFAMTVAFAPFSINVPLSSLIR